MQHLNSNPRPIKILFVVSFLIIFISPLFVHFNNNLLLKGLKIGLPKIQAGDEPHYLIMAASLIKDFDLELSNNYYDNRARSLHYAGKNYRGRYLDHHTYFINKNTYALMKWDLVYDAESLKRPYPFRPKMKDFKVDECKEYPAHFIGLPVILALFIWPFINTPFFEVAAIIIAVIASLIGIAFLYKIIFFYCKSEANSAAMIIFFVFGTPMWHYSRSVFSEPFAFCFLALFLYTLIKKKYLCSGFFLAAAVIIKPLVAIFIVMILPYIIIAEKNNKIKAVTEFLLPFTPFIILQLAYNHYLFKNIFKFPSFELLKPVSLLPELISESGKKAAGLLFSFREGLFAFSPFLLFSVLGSVNMFRQNRRDFFLWTIMPALYIVFFLLQGIKSGYCFGPRQMVPIISFLIIPIAYWYDLRRFNLTYLLFYICLIYSMIINMLGSFGYNRVFGKTIPQIFSTFF